MLAFLAALLAVAAPAPPPAWIQRVVPLPIVAWREADVLGASIPEGIAVDRLGDRLTVNVVDSRYDPPQIVHLRDLAGRRVRWLRAGTHDRLKRNQIAIDVVGPSSDSAYLLRVGPGSSLQVVKVVHGKKLGPAVFAKK